MGNLTTDLQKQGKKVLFAFEEAIGMEIMIVLKKAINCACCYWNISLD